MIWFDHLFKNARNVSIKRTVLSMLCNQTYTMGLLSYDAILDRVRTIAQLVSQCFDEASQEPKWDGKDPQDRVDMAGQTHV